MRYAIKQVITRAEYNQSLRSGPDMLNDMLRYQKMRMLRSLAERFVEEVGPKAPERDEFTGDMVLMFDMEILEAGEITRIQRNAEAWGRRHGAEEVKRSLPYGMSPDEQVEN